MLTMLQPIPSAFRIQVLCVVTTLLIDTLASAGFTERGSTVLGGVNFDSRSVSFADIDGDRDLDMFFQGGSSDQKLFRNNLIGNGTFTFTNISSQLPSGLGPSWSAAWGDYDGDRRVDVFVGQSNISGAGDVMRNEGGGNFSNTSSAVGLNDPGFHQNVAWNDIDNDRDLDLIIAMEGPEKHEIYRQGANGMFTPFGSAAGFQADVGIKAYGMAIGDTDGDGDLDIYISTCRGDNNIRNNFYENRLAQTGSLSFVDIADSNGTQFTKNSYGAEFHDFDDDGDLDLFMVGADGERSKIFRNNGGNQFTDVDLITGRALLSNNGGDYNGGKAVDYDNDGDLDLFFHDHLARSGQNNARKLFRNDGNWLFTDVTSAQGIASTTEGGYDSGWADLDLDGDQDLVAATDAGFAERVFLNDASTNGNHWLYVRLIGREENSTAIGATIYATTNAGTPLEKTIRREANTNAGTFNQSDLPVHLGLGSTSTIDELLVVFPDGTERVLKNVSSNRYLKISNMPCDFDANALCNITDLNDLLAEGPLATGVMVTNGDNDQFDMNGDGILDVEDRDLWLAMAASENGLSTPYKLGDANLDGVVDGTDFGIWNSAKFTNSLRWSLGDFNADGVVDGSDFGQWNQNKFTSSDQVAALPEPQSLWVVILALYCLLFGRQDGHF